MLTVLLVPMAVLCGQLARPLAVTLLLATIATAALGWAYFFIAPASTATLAALSLANALMGPRQA